MTIVQQIEALFACPYEGENLWRKPRKPAFNANSYPARVRFAVWGIMEGDDSRRFDTCFEMYDGEAVVVAIMRAALGGKADYLAWTLENHNLTEAGWKSWNEKARKNAFWDDDQLGDFAAALRQEGRDLARAWQDKCEQMELAI